MQAIINGEMYEVEPAVKVIIDNLMIENARLKKENARLEELYQKPVGVIAATNCAECKDKAVKHGQWIKTPSPYHVKCSSCKTMVCIKFYGVEVEKFCRNCGAKMDLKDGESE
jgi:hypothetical protein